jgi:hypothetical protein
MAQYILNILFAQKMIVWCWGFNSPISLKNGLQFKVNGFIHKGTVKVIYNEGFDLFDIYLISKSHEIKKEINGIYFDELVEVIDNLVEKVDNYDERVQGEYSLL